MSMFDIYVSIAVVGVLATLGKVLSLHFGRTLSRRAGTLCCVAIVGLIVFHSFFVSGRLWIARLIPFSGVPVLGNAFLALVVGILAGLAWRVIPGHAGRRTVLIATLLGATLVRSVGPVLGHPPAGLWNRWRHSVAIQTSPATCSPAAAATLLREHGIAATESEMAELCLTTTRGTTALGLYRGLKLKTAGSAWDVEPFQLDPAGLRKLDGPAVLNVRLDRTPGVDPRYERLWGWTPGVSHTVVFLGFAHDGKVNIGDPAVGREQWFEGDLRVLWHGEGLRLVPRR
jgi:hypothetical protein